MKLPRFPENGDDGGSHFQQGTEVRIVLSRGSRPASAAECRHTGMLEWDVSGCFEEIDVLGVRAGPPTLDEIHAKVVEALEDL
jgi:hypothetical protein